MRTCRVLTLASIVSLIALGVAWELWLAPLRPGGSMLVFKVVPLVIALPPLARGHLRAYQWCSMGILLYVCEGLVRATSEPWPTMGLAWVEAAVSLVAFGSVLMYCRKALRDRYRLATPS